MGSANAKSTYKTAGARKSQPAACLRCQDVSPAPLSARVACGRPPRRTAAGTCAGAPVPSVMSAEFGLGLVGPAPRRASQQPVYGRGQSRGRKSPARGWLSAGLPRLVRRAAQLRGPGVVPKRPRRTSRTLGALRVLWLQARGGETCPSRCPPQPRLLLGPPPRRNRPRGRAGGRRNPLQRPASSAAVVAGWERAP